MFDAARDSSFGVCGVDKLRCVLIVGCDECVCPLGLHLQNISEHQQLLRGERGDANEASFNPEQDY